MFERIMARTSRAADARARAQAARLVERMKAELPPGIAAELVDGGIRILGRGLRRRFALESALRWLTARLR